MGKLIHSTQSQSTSDIRSLIFALHTGGVGQGREAVETIAQLCIRNLGFFNAQAYAVSII